MYLHRPRLEPLLDALRTVQLRRRIQGHL